MVWWSIYVRNSLVSLCDVLWLILLQNTSVSCAFQSLHSPMLLSAMQNDVIVPCSHTSASARQGFCRWTIIVELFTHWSLSRSTYFGLHCIFSNNKDTQGLFPSDWWLRTQHLWQVLKIHYTNVLLNYITFRVLKGRQVHLLTNVDLFYQPTNFCYYKLVINSCEMLHWG